MLTCVRDRNVKLLWPVPEPLRLAYGVGAFGFGSRRIQPNPKTSVRPRLVEYAFVLPVVFQEQAEVLFRQNAVGPETGGMYRIQTARSFIASAVAALALKRSSRSLGWCAATEGDRPSYV
jgi:hypothetical protein